ncbi:MAG: TatD family deoxyribonuclease [Ruminococcaceae bacterium]|nr:TatD family deoxyribonuclease [Oscillospiraceae bacterium]
MALIFDSHSHYDNSQFDEDRDLVLSSLKDKGVGAVMLAGCSLDRCYCIDELTKKYPFVFGSAGIHPIDCKEHKGPYLEKLRELFKANKKLAAVGEIGLDYHYDTPKDLQKKFFTEQLELARELNKPVIIHSREATGDMLEILKEFRPKGVVHCFSGSVETAREVLDLGLYIGFTGVVTFKNAAKAQKSAAFVPLDRLLIETDCPYMAPTPYRGERCDSSMLIEVARVLAGLKNVTTEEILDKTFKNAVTVYELEGLI